MSPKPCIGGSGRVNHTSVAEKLGYGSDEIMV
jgi:hypothetical protein